MLLRIDLGMPFGLDHDGLMRLDDQRGPLDAMARLQLLAEIDRRLMPGAASEERSRRMRGGCAGRQRPSIQFFRRLAAAAGLDFDCLDLDVFFRADEAEALLMRDLEQRLHAAQTGDRDRQRAIGAGITEMRLRHDPDRARSRRLAA